MSATSQDTFAATVAAIQAQGAASGLSPDQINAAIAVAQSEGGLLTSVGDYAGPGNTNPTSFGPLQFHIGGELNSFATWLGTTLAQAQAIAGSSLQDVTQFALEPGGYLYNALEAGAQAGYAGASLATYASQYGQRSAYPQNAGKAWESLFGGTSSQPPVTAPVSSGATGALPQITTTTGKVSTATVPQELAAIWQAMPSLNFDLTNPLGSIGTLVGQVFQYALSFVWIIIGLLIAIVGLWLLVRSNQ